MSFFVLLIFFYRGLHIKRQDNIPILQAFREDQQKRFIIQNIILPVMDVWMMVPGKCGIIARINMTPLI